jgi:dihydrofolate reductase
VERLVGSQSAISPPCIVLTHHARPPLALEGGTTFTFVTDGIAAALERARRAARGLDVSLAGGAGTAQQYLGAGLVDEMEIHLVPMLLSAGERLFEGVREHRWSSARADGSRTERNASQVREALTTS